MFVTTRAGGTADLWTLDLQTRRAKALTSGAGGDFRPSWSPDGQWIAFSSDRAQHDAVRPRPVGASAARRHLRHPSGRIGPEADHRARRLLRQPEVDAPTAGACIAYCMDAEQTLDNRRPVAGASGNDTRIVSIDIATGAIDRRRRRARASSSTRRSLGRRRSATSARTATAARHLLRERQDAARRATFAPRRGRPTARASSSTRRSASPRKPWVKTCSRNPDYELTLTGMRAVVQSRRRSLRRSSDRPPRMRWAPASRVATAGSDNVQGDLSRTRRATSSAPQWSPSGEQDHLRHRRLQRVLQRLPRPVPQAGGSRRRRRADRDRQSPMAAASAS